MRMHGFNELVIASSGTLPNAFKAAFVGPPPEGEGFIGTVLTTNFRDGTGPVATYGDLRDGVRYGWPLMFALGWAGSYVFWRWRWKKTGRLNGLGNAIMDELIAASNDLKAMSSGGRVTVPMSRYSAAIARRDAAMRAYMSSPLSGTPAEHSDRARALRQQAGHDRSEGYDWSANQALTKAEENDYWASSPIDVWE